MLNILVITNRDNLTDHFKLFGNVVHMPTIEAAQNLIDSDEIDVVVVSLPYSREGAAKVNHNKVKYIGNDNDLKEVKKSFAFEKRRREQTVPEPNKRHLRSNKDKNIDYSEAKAPFLLVSTNAELLRTFNLFPQCDMVTNGFTAKRYINQRQYSLVVWDLPNNAPRIDIPIYKWGEEVKTPKDVFLFLVTGQLSLVDE